MWRTDPVTTLSNPNALATKIVEKGWRTLSPAEKKKAIEWEQTLQVLLPQKDGDALLTLIGKKREKKANPKSRGKIALIKKIKAGFRKKRQQQNELPN